MAGLTSTGITIKDVDEILADMVSDQLANIDANLNTESDGVLGQLNGIYAAALAELWELLEEIYQSAYPDTASGQSLSYVAALTGAIRQEATKAELEVRLTGTVSTVVPSGTQFYVDGDPDSIFQTTADATIQEHGATDYEDVIAQAVTAGSATTIAATDDLVIATPVTGLTLVAIDTTNPFADAFAEGLDEETDAELRTRREQTLAQAGSSTVEAIRTDMLGVTGVDSCTVFENPTGDYDVNAVPPYAIEVLIYSEAAPNYVAQEVADQLWASKPAGTETYGSYGAYVTDSQGNQHLMEWSIPVTVRLYVAVTLTAATDGTYVGDAAVQAEIGAWASSALTVGRSVYASDLVNVVADIVGVVSVDVGNVFVEAGDATPDTTQWIASARQLGTIDGDNDVTVTS